MCCGDVIYGVAQLRGGVDSYAGVVYLLYVGIGCGGALIIRKLSSDCLKQSSDFSKMEL